MKSKKKNTLSAHNSLINDKTPFAIKEAFSALRTNILYTNTVNSQTPVYGVVSAQEGAGKSTVIANLAKSFALISKKVVIIDADMRRPVQHEFFGYKKDAVGLSEFLSGIAKTKEEIIVKTNDEYLDAIPSGRVPPNPSELVLSNRFEELIEKLKNSYDYIFIDFPPVGIISDALSVVNYISGYIFVVRANMCETTAVNEALSDIEKVNGNVIGIVMNDINYKDGFVGGKYSTKYGKYHSYDRAAKEID